MMKYVIGFCGTMIIWLIFRQIVGLRVLRVNGRVFSW